MVGIAVFAVVLVAIFTIKALTIYKTCDDIVSNATAFCWSQADASDAAPTWLEEDTRIATPAPVSPLFGRRASIA